MLLAENNIGYIYNIKYIQTTIFYKEEFFMLKGQKGITLITLVITIVILIILAGVAISLSLSDNGIFNRAKEGRDLYVNAQRSEEEMANSFDTSLNELLNGM